METKIELVLDDVITTKEYEKPQKVHSRWIFIPIGRLNQLERI